MDIEFVCEHCGKLLKVGGYLAGQSTECYYCHQQVTVPNEGQRAVIEFECLGCGSKFRVPATRAGSRTKCPKCQALLVVPQAGATSAATPPIAESQDITPGAPASFARPAAATAAARPPVPGDQSPFAPRSRIKLGADGQPLKAKGVPMGMIIFWIVVGTLLIVGLIMYGLSGGGVTGTAPDNIVAEVKVNTAGFIKLVQGDVNDWNGVTITLQTTAGTYTYFLPVITKGEDKLLNYNLFANASGPFGVEKGSVSKIIIDVEKLANGHRGECTIGVGGPKAPPPGASH